MDEEPQQDFEESVDTVLKKSQLQQEQLKILYNEKERQLKVQYESLRKLIQNIWEIKESEYNEHVICDQFLGKYLKDLEEDFHEIDWNKVNWQQDENNESKQEREQQLSKLREMWNAQSNLLMIMKGYTDLSSAYKSLMEELNTQIFKGQQEREILENNQQQFSSRLKELRGDIKSTTEKNQRLMKEIENIKSSY